MSKKYIAPDVSLLKDSGLTALKFAVANEEFKEIKNTAALGKTDNGNIRYLNLTGTSGVYIKGDNSADKIRCLHSIILSMLFKYSPDELRFIFIDTKGNEFNYYNGLPHSMTPSPIRDYGQALSALRWAVAEGERRFSLFKEMTDKGYIAADIGRYNAISGVSKLPQIVIFLNDLEDVLRRAANAFLSALIRILQKLRFAGIHVLMSTRAINESVVPDYFLRNIDTKILYKSDGGFMYISPLYEPEHLRELYFDEREIFTVINFIKNNNEVFFCGEFIEKIKDTQALKNYDDHKKLAKLCMVNKYISVAMIQNSLSADYDKALEFLNWLENNFYISSEGENRRVTVPISELIGIYGEF